MEPTQDEDWDDLDMGVFADDVAEEPEAWAIDELRDLELVGAAD